MSHKQIFLKNAIRHRAITPWRWAITWMWPAASTLVKKSENSVFVPANKLTPQSHHQLSLSAKLFRFPMTIWWGFTSSTTSPPPNPLAKVGLAIKSQLFTRPKLGWHPLSTPLKRCVLWSLLSFQISSQRQWKVAPTLRLGRRLLLTASLHPSWLVVVFHMWGLALPVDSERKTNTIIDHHRHKTWVPKDFSVSDMVCVLFSFLQTNFCHGCGSNWCCESLIM